MVEHVENENTVPSEDQSKASKQIIDETVFTQTELNSVSSPSPKSHSDRVQLHPDLTNIDHPYNHRQIKKLKKQMSEQLKFIVKHQKKNFKVQNIKQHNHQYSLDSATHVNRKVE